MYYGAILVSTKPGSEEKVYNSLMHGAIKDNFVDLKRVCPIFGEYDLIVEVETPNTDSLQKFASKLRSLPDITDVKPLEPKVGFGQKGIEDKLDNKNSQ